MTTSARAEGRRLWTTLAPLVVWVAVILWVASRPVAFFYGPDVRVVWGIRRGLLQYPYHVGVFFVLAILFLRFLRHGRQMGLARAACLSVLGCLAVSIASELIQIAVPTRTAAVGDLVLDLAGAVPGIVTGRRLVQTSSHLGRRRAWTSASCPSSSPS